MWIETSTVAYELQRRGYQVAASPAPFHRADDPVKIGYECFIGNRGKLKIERAISGDNYVQDFIGRLMKHGEGSRFAISQSWGNPRKREGHTYIAEKINGRILFIDPQKGKPNVSHYLNDVRMKDEKRELFFYRIDNAFLNSKMDFKGVVEPYTRKGKIDKADSFTVLSKEDKSMTKDEARAILEKSEDLATITDEEGVTWHYQISDLFFAYPDCFGFAVYIYTSKKPIDPKYAFEYFVDKKTGEVECADSPMVEEEFEKMGG